MNKPVHVSPHTEIFNNVLFPRVWKIKKELEESYGKRFVAHRAKLFRDYNNPKAKYHHILEEKK